MGQSIQIKHTHTCLDLERSLGLVNTWPSVHAAVCSVVCSGSCGCGWNWLCGCGLVHGRHHTLRGSGVDRLECSEGLDKEVHEDDPQHHAEYAPAPQPHRSASWSQNKQLLGDFNGCNGGDPPQANVSTANNSKSRFSARAQVDDKMTHNVRNWLRWHGLRVLELVVRDKRRQSPVI